jgi:protein TonB
MGRLGNLVAALTVCAVLSPGTGRTQEQNHAERKVINRIAPVYPALAKRMHVSGVVKLEVVIRANGEVKSTSALGGNPVLIEAAVSAVQKWKFESAHEESSETIQLVFPPQ